MGQVGSWRATALCLRSGVSMSAPNALPRRTAISADMATGIWAACRLSIRDKATRVTPGAFATSVTDRPREYPVKWIPVQAKWYREQFASRRRERPSVEPRASWGERDISPIDVATNLLAMIRQKKINFYIIDRSLYSFWHLVSSHPQ